MFSCSPSLSLHFLGEEKEKFQKQEQTLQKRITELKRRITKAKEEDKELFHLQKKGPIFICDLCGNKLTGLICFDLFDNWRHHCAICPDYDLCHDCYLSLAPGEGLKEYETKDMNRKRKKGKERERKVKRREKKVKGDEKIFKRKVLLS